MRARRTQAPRPSRSRTVQRLVAAALALPLALGTLTTTAQPAAALLPAEITLAGQAVAGQLVFATLVCPSGDQELTSITRRVYFGGAEPVGTNIFPSHAGPEDSTFTVVDELVFPAPGTYRVEMDCNDGMGQDVVQVDVAAATTTTVRLFPAAVEPHNPILAEAQVQTAGPLAGGTVQFSLDGFPVGGPVPVDSSGYSHASIPNPGWGSYSVTATYSGTAAFGSSSSSAESVWVKYSPEVKAVIPDDVRGTATLSATVVGYPELLPPTGTVTFYFGDGERLGSTTLAGATATLQVDLPPDVYPGVFAVYSGDEVYGDGKSVSRDMVVNPSAPVKSPAAVTVTAPAAVTGSTVDLSVAVDPGQRPSSVGAAAMAYPTGTVAVTLGTGGAGGASQTAPLVDGVATLTLTDVAPGTYQVTASYSGDQYYEVATGHATTTVKARALVKPAVTVPSTLSTPVATPRR